MGTIFSIDGPAGRPAPTEEDSSCLYWLLGDRSG